MKLAAAFLIALTAFGQTLEIRGTVFEQGPSVPLPGAEVTIFELTEGEESAAIGTVFTDASGAYVFRPSRVGNFRVEVKKPGYTTQDGSREVAGARVYVLPDLARAAFVQRLSLAFPGSLTGRVVDEDRMPIAGLHVYVEAATVTGTRPFAPYLVTNEEGIFIAPRLVSQEYVVRIAPQSAGGVTMLDDSAGDFEIVDRDIEASLSRIQVQPGTPADIGTIILRTIPYYRARISFRGDCAAGEEWQVRILKLPYDARSDENRRGSTPCRNQFLIRDLAAGSYSLAVKTDSRWSLTPFTVASENIEASMNFSPNTDLTAALVIPSGVTQLGSLPNLRIQLTPVDAPAIGTAFTFEAVSEGRFAIHGVPWSRMTLAVRGLPPTHYVKELRYAGRTMRDLGLAVSPGGHIDVILGDHPATISGTVKGMPAGIQTASNLVIVTVTREGYRRPPSNVPFSYANSVNDAGAFAFTGLAPGDYRVMATRLSDFARLDENVVEGQLVRVTEGETKSIEVTLK